MYKIKYQQHNHFEHYVAKKSLQRFEISCWISLIRLYI